MTDGADFRHETERLVLRDWQAGDAEKMWEISNTPAVMRWLGGVFDEKGKRAQISRIETCRRANRFCFWIVERHDDGGHLSGEMLGMCGLKRADAPGSSVAGEMEIGWRFRESSWGHGYAREAAQTALKLGFTAFGADRIVSLTVADNTSSWGLMRRLGMERRTDLDYSDSRYEPPWRDAIVYFITREEWERTQ